MIKNNYIKASFLTFLVFITFLWTEKASSNLLIMPIYAIFEDRERTADITLINTSNQTSTYRMTWSHYQQNEGGSYDKKDGSIYPNYNVEDMIIFSPRQVTLPAGARQRVRMSLRRPPDLPQGEYRAHLRMQRVGSADRRTSANQGGGINTSVGINVGFAVPVIIRHGTHNAAASIENPVFQPAPGGSDTRPRLQVTLKRQGTHGTMGRLTVFWTKPGGKEEKIGILNNVNIFSEIDQRIAKIPLTENNVNSGTIRITYEGAGPDDSIVFDEQTFPIGG